MADWRLNADAEADLRGIFNYSAEIWGDARAEAYLGKLVRRFERLRTLPFKTEYDLIEGLRSTRAEHHIVFWLLERDRTPEIIAVLHERMDLLNHLRQRLGPAPE